MNDQSVLEAKLDEAEALIESLRARCVALNVEVRSRDESIRSLTGRIEALEAAAPPQQPDSDTADD